MIVGAASLLLVAGCSGDRGAGSSTTLAAPTTTEAAEPAVDVRLGLFDCGPFSTRLGREMTYFIRLFDDGTMAEVMSQNPPDEVFAAVAQRRSDDLSTDIGVGPFTVSGDRFSAATSDTLSYQITYDGTVVAPDELRLRVVSSLYDFDEERTCTHLAVG